MSFWSSVVEGGVAPCAAGRFGRRKVGKVCCAAVWLDGRTTKACVMRTMSQKGML